MTAIHSQLFDALNSVEPVWSGFTSVSDVVPLKGKFLLHAGPPFKAFKDIPQAVLNSLCIGSIFEGWANSEQEALNMLVNGDIAIYPAQSFNIVVPLAGVVSPSMRLIIVSDLHQASRQKYSVLNEGMTLCTRLGLMNLDIVKHLHWLNGEFAQWLEARVTAPIKLAPILQQALLNGDDGHARTMFASKLFSELIQALNPQDVPTQHQSFLDGSLAFALNFWMAMSSLILSVAEDYPDNVCITKVGGNGYEFGIQLSNNPGTWITDKAPTINGKKEDQFKHLNALGSIGDSPVVDFLGLGGQVLDLAVYSSRNLIDFLPADYAERTANISMGRLNILGNRYGISDVHKMLSYGKGPLVLLGMIDQSGQHGRIGGGVLDTPIETIKNLVKGYV